jgi:long-subunit acyl-CoA synthetase (AMP-forming)
MAETVVELFEATVRAHAAVPALARRRAGRWETVTWSAYRDGVRHVAAGLVALGVERGQGVVILSANRPEWYFAHLAAISIGARPAGIYTNSTPEQCRYIGEHAQAVVALVDDERALDRMLAGGRPAGLREIVLMEGGGRPGVLAWDELLARGDSGAHAEEVARRASALAADEVCTLIYTSGTTGTPKAVMLTHANLRFIARRAREDIPVGPGEPLVCYLPLSHIAEQGMSFLLSMATGACVHFVQALEELPQALREVRPRAFLGVPRVWEKVQAAVQAAAAQASPLQQRLLRWALRKGLQAGEAAQHGGTRPWGHWLAERLVLSKVRRRLGFDQARLLLVSAAPTASETLEFFQSLGMPLMELYGMSECTGPTTVSVPGCYRLGRAGRALPGTELRIAEDGEILIRGPHVFAGYARDEEATREVLDDDGWLHSGDVGELDPEGFLRVTDRKKELIITAGGKNIAPQYLEGRLKQIPGVSQAVAVGDRRPYVVALLTLDPARVAAEAKRAGSPARTAAEAAHLEAQVEQVNRSLARYETVKRVALLPRELDVASGELTPTLKLKRRVIAERYREQIEALYA